MSLILFVYRNKTNFELIYLRTNPNIYRAVNLKLSNRPGPSHQWGNYRKKEEHKILAFDKDKFVIIEIITHKRIAYLRPRTYGN